MHGILTRCARAVAAVVKGIKTLITLAHVVGFDETTLRCGPAGENKYVLSASTEDATAYYLGGRDLDSFAGFGILPAFAEVAVHDRYGSYFHPRWDQIPEIAGHVRDELAVEFRRAVRVGLSQVPLVPGPRKTTAQLPGRDLLEFCRDRQADVLRCTTDTRIWPTNNISEHHLRPTKTQQKISGRLTSQGITQDRLDIRSYIDTARK